MSKQKVFTDTYIVKLRSDIEKNLENYFSDTFPIEEVDEEGRNNVIDSRFNCNDHLLDKMMMSNTAEAAIELYKAFPNLTPAEAAQKNLWSYLSHVDLFPYMKTITRQAKTVGAIEDNYFGAPTKQALSSLWWIVYLTVDNTIEDKDAQYKYTRFLLENGHSDLALLMSQSTLFRCRSFSKGVLQFLMDNDYSSNLIAVGRYIIPYYNKKGGRVQLASWNWKDFYDDLSLKKEMLKELKLKNGD